MGTCFKTKLQNGSLQILQCIPRLQKPRDSILIWKDTTDTIFKSEIFTVAGELKSSLNVFFFLSHHLLQLFRRMRQNCFVDKLPPTYQWVKGWAQDSSAIHFLLHVPSLHCWSCRLSGISSKRSNTCCVSHPFEKGVPHTFSVSFFSKKHIGPWFMATEETITE